MKYKTDELQDDLEEDCLVEVNPEKKTDKMAPRSHGKEVLTDRNGEVVESSLNERKTKMDGKEKKLVKEPVENTSSDGEENRGHGAEENEDLSDALSKCCITEDSETKVGSNEEDIVDKISNLRVSDDNKNESQDEGKFIEIKSSDIKTKEELALQKEKDNDCKALSSRGPTGGMPTNYYQNNPQYNHVAQKSYPFPVGVPDGYMQPYAYNQQVMCSGYEPSKPFQQMNFNPKRNRDDFDEQPVKYTRPGQEINNLSDPSKTQTCYMTYSNVSTQGFCGGQVAVTSPEEDIPPIFGGKTTSGEFEIGILKDETYLKCEQVVDPKPRLQQINPQQINFASIAQKSYLDQSNVNLRSMVESRHGAQENRKSFSEYDGGSEGYASDAIASPYSEQQDSPGANDQSLYSPPPSNISTDSGTGCSMVPSPGSQHDICSPRSNLSGYETGSDTYPNSPYAQKGTLTPQHMPLGQEIPTQQFNQVYPPTMVRADPPTQFTQNTQQDFFDAERLTDLIDVMDTIANDLVESEQSKQRKIQQPAQQTPPLQKVPITRLPQQKPPASKPPTTNRPVASVPPSMVPVNAAQNTTNIPPNSLYFVSQPQPQQTIAQAVRPINSQSKPSNQATVTTSQILVIPANPQPQPPAIVIVAPALQPAKKGPQFRPIQPKIPSNPAPGKTADIKQGTPPGPNKTPVSKVAPAQVTVNPPVAPVQPTPRPKPANQTPKTNITQLNIARRLVATMKSEDLKFTDKDGDTFLHVAVCRADKYMVQALLERLVREGLHNMIDMQNNERQTPVYLAVSANQPEMVKMFNKYGADVNLLAEGMSSNGQKEVRAAIHCASCNGQEYLETLKVLLESQDLNLNIANSDGYTALHCAILEHNKPRHVNEETREQVLDLKTDSKPIVEALIKAGADPNAQDKKSGKTAFMYALETRDYSLVEKLLQLVEISKIRSYFRTQAFDGSTCIKIMESRKSEFPQGLYERLSSIISNSKTAAYQPRVIDVA